MGRCRFCRATPEAERKGGEANRQVEAGANAKRAVKPVKLDQNERNQGTGDCPHQIRCIEKTERAARILFGVAANGPHGKGDGSAHASAPGKQRDSHKQAGHKVIGCR